MANSAAMEASIWEKLGDGLTAFSEGFARVLTRVLGSSNERFIRSLGYLRPSDPGKPHQVVPGSLLDQVNRLEDRMRGLGDEQLREMTPEWRRRLAGGATLDDLLPEVFEIGRAHV